MLGWHTLIATQNNNEPITFYLFYLLTFSVKFLPSHKKVFCTWTFVQLCHWWRNGWRHRAHSTHYVVFSSTGAEHSRAFATGTVLEKLHIILLKAILRLIVLIPCWCDKQTTQRSLKLEWRPSRTCARRCLQLPDRDTQCEWLGCFTIQAWPLWSVTVSSWCESLHSVYTRRHFKGTTLSGFKKGLPGKQANSESWQDGMQLWMLQCLCPHHMCVLCECAKEDNPLMFLSTVYCVEGYKEVTALQTVTVLFTTQETQGWLTFVSGRWACQLGEWGQKGWKKQVKEEQQTATSRERKKMVNLLKKVVKDEMNEEEKKYFGKRKRKWNGNWKRQQQQWKDWRWHWKWRWCKDSKRRNNDNDNQ